MSLILRKCQGQGQAKQGHQMKMSHEYRAINVWCVIWIVEFDGDIHFFIWPEIDPISGQVMSSFKFQNILQKQAYFVQFCFKIKKNIHFQYSY